jgi:hypothetical protein
VRKIHKIHYVLHNNLEKMHLFKEKRLQVHQKVAHHQKMIVEDFGAMLKRLKIFRINQKIIQNLLEITVMKTLMTLLVQV